MAKVDESVIVYELADGWYVVELLTHYDYLREGGLMGNCVAKYFDSEDTVYSLRNDRHEPHASMLYRGKMMIEICGRFNSSLICDRYGARDHLQLEIVAHLRSLGRFYDLNAETSH